MKIRRFYSQNVRTALKQVTEAFGEEAAILSNKKVPGGVEIIAALDYDESLMPINPTSGLASVKFENDADAQAKRIALSEAAENEKSSDTKADVTNSSNSLNGVSENKLNSQSNLKKASLNQTDISKSDINQLNSQASGKGSHHPASSFEWSLDPSLQAMKEELELMRSMMAEQLKGIAWNRFTEKDPLKAMLMRRMAELGLDSECLNILLESFNFESAMENHQDAECCWQNMLATLAKSLPMGRDELISLDSGEGAGGIYALIGPTGVGKTTTIAKLAARFVIKYGCDSVALISTDNHRITAQEQLATFGRLLKVQTASVNARNPLDSLLKKYADKKLILIDTAGISASNSPMLKPLDEIKSSQKPIKKLLLMSATSQAAVLKQSLQLFSAISPNALVITKLDEATSLGEILSVILKSNFPVVYTTDGQKIPEDIRVARAQHLVSKAVWLANKYSRKTEEWGLAQSMDQAKSA